MYKIAKFQKVSREQFEKDWEFGGANPYEDIRLPRRGTAGSAGYDFFSPLDFELKPGEFIKIPTGIRAQMEDGWVLTIYPRSGQGFKYRLQLYNTVGVIDADYFGAANEGHIQVKIVNANGEGKVLSVKKGEAFAQGIFLPFGITVDDEAAGVRTGGFGSTDGGAE
ncbi:MAG: deoxyuridine 5'-triphosphate nucleotidohydrolase [Clostridia bacterium]|nr:deoxyuridine 5'-triphosphate nucleotidohydrolase [Clostridia bacterium]